MLSSFTSSERFGEKRNMPDSRKPDDVASAAPEADQVSYLQSNILICENQVSTAVRLA
jgi:hypothetical protein